VICPVVLMRRMLLPSTYQALPSGPKAKRKASHKPKILCPGITVTRPDGAVRRIAPDEVIHQRSPSGPMTSPANFGLLLLISLTARAMVTRTTVSVGV